ncbi:MAG: T9SS type A sorting domain-containing protein [Bacteroidetes bacterium]|nr:T9SS type A sorting domain-containing protein [Bacteroidota bacterium]
MKNQLHKSGKISIAKFLLLILLLGAFFSLFIPKESKSQTYHLTGTVFVYLSDANENDTTGVSSSSILKLYYMDGSGNLVYIKQTPVNSDGTFSTWVNTTSDLYAVIFEDDQDDNFVTSFYPGFLDYESAEPIALSEAVNGVIEIDWGAVGKEIVERPLTSDIVTVNGRVSLEGSSDFLPTIYVFQGDMPVTSATVRSDGSYSLNISVGDYEVFVSAPGYESQSKFVSSAGSKNMNLNFALSTYRGESLTNSILTSDGYVLNQNYPNPFNPTTNIKYSIPTGGLVKLSIYNLLGKEVASLINRYQEAGSYSIEFNGSELASGVYIYKLTSGNTVVTKKMNLIK